MRYHDFHLDKYEVSNRGKTITFHLVYDYPNTAKEESIITFSDVRLYNFTHTASTIITDIEEASLPDMLEEIGDRLTEWNRLYSVDLWDDTLENYRHRLQSNGYKA